MYARVIAYALDLSRLPRDIFYDGEIYLIISPRKSNLLGIFPSISILSPAIFLLIFLIHFPKSKMEKSEIRSAISGA